MSDVQISSGNKYFLKWVAAICRGAGPLSLPAMLMMVFSPSLASAAPLSLQGAEAIALRQNPGTATDGIGNTDAIAASLRELFDRAVPKSASVRLLGITVSGLVHVQAASRVAHQMSLLDEILNPR